MWIWVWRALLFGGYVLTQTYWDESACNPSVDGCQGHGDIYLPPE